MSRAGAGVGREYTAQSETNELDGGRNACTCGRERREARLECGMFK